MPVPNWFFRYYLFPELLNKIKKRPLAHLGLYLVI